MQKIAMVLATAAALNTEQEPDLPYNFEKIELDTTIGKSGYKDCQMVKDARNGRMMLAFKGSLIPIPGKDTFDNLFVKQAWYNNIKEENAGKIDKLLSKGGFHEDAYLARSQDNSNIYLVSGKAHQIADEKTFDICQFNWDKIKWIPKGWTLDKSKFKIKAGGHHSGNQGEDDIGKEPEKKEEESDEEPEEPEKEPEKPKEEDKDEEPEKKPEKPKKEEEPEKPKPEKPKQPEKPPKDDGKKSGKIPSGFWTKMSQSGHKWGTGWGTASGDEAIVFKGKNGKWASMNWSDGHHMAANRDAPGPQEKWKVHTNSDGTISLQGWNTKFVTCDAGKMAATQTQINQNEKWKVVVNSDKSISLKSAYGKYAGINSAGQMGCMSGSIGADNKFHGWK